jgi:hydroxymethylpyrimidine kinase/phosphomethylpyrimidine kinase
VADLTIRRVPFALSVAGSDPTGGAGILADVQVFRTHGVLAGGVITALTVQDTKKVHQVLPAFPSVVLEQLRAALADLKPDAVKLGMLATDDIARMVSLALDSLGPPEARSTRLVIDPVLAASDGTPLLERRAIGTLGELVRGASLVTPNLPEAGELTGRDVSTRAGTEEAARMLVLELGAGAALLKGGHREGAPDDLLALRDGSGVAFRWLGGERIPGPPVHGTGCALAAAATARLARGEAIETAVVGAREWLREAIRGAVARGSGQRLLDLAAPPSVA